MNGRVQDLFTIFRENFLFDADAWLDVYKNC